jgi:DNA-binding transcriptional ArsR family regulator
VDLDALTRIFRALGDQTRLRLVSELAQRGELTCGEFAALCACSNSALTYHQRILSDAGVIAVRRAGQFRVLALQREVLDQALPGFLERLAGLPEGAPGAAHAYAPADGFPLTEAVGSPY